MHDLASGLVGFCLLRSILKYAWERADLILAENSLRRAAGVGGWGSWSLHSRVKPNEKRSATITPPTGGTEASSVRVQL